VRYARERTKKNQKGHKNCGKCPIGSKKQDFLHFFAQIEPII
jgi:hypothetical protein